MRRACLTATLMTLALAGNALAMGDGADSASQLRDQVEQGYQSRSVALIEQARAELLALNPAVAGNERAPYYAAHARFRQGLLAGDQSAGRNAARDYLDDCITELNGYVDAAPADAEARALLGSCYGISTRYHRLALATRGLQARSHMAAARKLAPQNPWVMLQDGLADFATPALVGGDRKLAISKLERAIGIFTAAAERGSRLAALGAAEAWLQLSTMYRETGRLVDADKARVNAQVLASSGGGTRIAGI